MIPLALEPELSNLVVCRRIGRTVLTAHCAPRCLVPEPQTFAAEAVRAQVPQGNSQINAIGSAAGHYIWQVETAAPRSPIKGSR